MMVAAILHEVIPEPGAGMARCICGAGPGPIDGIREHVKRKQPKPVLSHVGAIQLVSAMSAPVRCANCGSIYDSGHVKVTARFADASLWKAPCCGIESDDRPYVGRAIRLYTLADIEGSLGPTQDGIIRRRIVQPDGTDY